MKAVRMHSQGGVEVLRYEDAPDPVPGPGEALVRVRACALNHLDVWVRQGGRSRLTMPHILGSDIAGVLEQGGEAQGLSKGERVMVFPGITCGRCQRCLSGQEELCLSYSIIGARLPGGYAQLAVVPEANLLPIPRDLSFEEAAAIPLVFTTAWHMLVSRAQVQPGEMVLVHAAGSGVGSVAIQIAKLWGARVIATASSDEKLQKARALGADEVINYSTEDFVQRALDMSSGRGVDVVVDNVGGKVMEDSPRALAMGGRLVTCGATAGGQMNLSINYLFARRLTIMGSYMGTRAELMEAMKFVEQGRLKAVVHAVLPLQEAAKAHSLMNDRANFGKLVLSVS